VSALWSVGLHALGFALVMVGLVCVFIALWVGIGVGTHENYEVPTPYWCWINPHFLGERLAGEYIWIWAALFSAVVLYVPLYFWAEGRLSVDMGKWYKFHVSKPDRGVECRQRKTTLRILLYPLAYSLVVLPLSVARWLLFSHMRVPSAATFFAVSMFHLSGAVNVLLFLIVRPQLLLFTCPEVGQHKELGPQNVNLKIPRYTETYEYSHTSTATPGSVDCAPSGIGAVSLGNSRRGSYV